LGAKLIVISSEKHDKIVAEISHLPHVVAFSLVNSCISSIKFAGNSFKDATRVASSDVNIWLDIFFSNKINIIKSINKFIDNINYIKTKIKSGRKRELRKVLARAKLVREKLIRSDKKDSYCH
jgi:prephenate dehydrogenase